MNSEEGEVTKEKRKMTESPLMIKSKELALLYIKKLNSGIMCAKKDGVGRK